MKLYTITAHKFDFIVFAETHHEFKELMQKAWRIHLEEHNMQPFELALDCMKGAGVEVGKGVLRNGSYMNLEPDNREYFICKVSGVTSTEDFSYFSVNNGFSDGDVENVRELHVPESLSIAEGLTIVRIR